MPDGPCVVVVGSSTISVSFTVLATDHTPVWKFFDRQWLFRKLTPRLK